MPRFTSFSRHSFGVRNRAPWNKIILHSFHQFHDNDLFTSAAAMSYFGLLTLFPALLLLLTISSSIPAGAQMLTQFVRIFPASADFLRTTIRSLENVNTGVVISCVVVVLWAGSWVFAVIERALNRVWGSTPRTFFHGRALTLAMIGSVGVVLLISVLLTSIAVFLQDMLSRLPLRVLERWTILTLLGSAFWQIIFALGSILLTVLIFIVVYRFMPNTEVTIRDTIPGAVVSGVLWEMGKYIFAWLLHYFHYDQIYGSVGAVVAVLTWSYVSSLILLFGAQLTAVFHREHPLEKIPTSSADAATAPM
ncbi:MAG: YihY/virulence factor BrkB family protein [Acidobacteria bacterium]|nr:YihY/virulence factor BrkB family protein [Acidobacteriota bacterium]